MAVHANKLKSFIKIQRNDTDKLNAYSVIPMFTIANMAGNTWLKKCGKAYNSLNTKEEPGIPTQLLSDIREVLATKPKISSADLVLELKSDKDKPWFEYSHGRPISQNAIAKILKPFGIKPKGIRIKNSTPRGYELKQFTDTFDRYLNPLP